MSRPRGASDPGIPVGPGAGGGGAGKRPARVLVVESSRSVLKRAHELYESFGLAVSSADDAGAGGRAVAGGGYDLVMAGLPGHEEVVRAALAQGESRPSIIVTVAPNERRPAEVAAACGADSAVHRPLKRDALGLAVRAGLLLRVARRRITELERRADERGRVVGGADPSTGFYPFELFKRLLMMELKRAKRYEYSLAVALVGLDAVGVEISPEVRGALLPALASVVGECIRDIDIPVDYADGRFLVFLPYTDLAGAERVGQRIVGKLRRGAFRDGERTLTVTASVGVAAQRPGGAVSFANLMRDALVALKAAQLKGGDRVVVRAARGPMVEVES
ncbi:MAG: GGDEF domain-containing protein [Deltaproteobacteria bacterium]|nr:GGDEF domain-containing protein [Deltaproteobacteria bacterium]